MRPCRRRRSGRSAVEFALVSPVIFVLLLGLVIGATGVFRYQQVAHLARDASRWASVHGAQYATITGKPAATAQDVYNKVIAPNAVGLNLNYLSYSVTWNRNNSQYYTQTVNGQTVNTANTVTVTITYTWIPEAFTSPVTLKSSSTSIMSF